ncbi:MAG: Crp/Fnr family transcriptional regulator [Mangrovibacterium sp.]
MRSGSSRTLNQLKDFFSEHKVHHFKKGDVFLNYGEMNHKMGLLIEGMMYAAYVNESSQEWISRFFYLPNNGIVSSHESFMTRQKSSEIIRAYEDSKMIIIERYEYEKIMTINRRLERLARVMAEENYVQALQRIHSLQSLTAQQRVARFMKEHGEIVNRVQRQHVASYLGIHRNIFTKVLRGL